MESHSDVADDLLAIHALSGTDAVSSLHGIGKATVVKVAKKGCFPLFCIGDVHAEIKSVEAHATKFTCASYGKVAESCNSMTQCRVKMWRSKTGKSGASSMKLCSIPPTTEAFKDVCTDATFKWQYREDGRFFKCHCTKCCTPSGKCCLRPTMCKTRPAGRVRPATRFCPAREMFLSYNGNRPAASHRPPLHYTNNYGIGSLGCLLLHRLKTNVTNNVRFFDNALLNA